MQSQIRGITALLLSTVIFLMGNGLVGTLIPLRANLEGFSNIWVGALGASYFAGFIAGCYGGPQLLSRVGHIRSFAVASALIAASVIMLPIWPTQASWSVLRGLTGICTAIIFMAIESWLNDRATNETRGRILAIYIGANFGALLIGQWMLLLGLPTSFELFSIAAILYCLCLVPIGLTRLPAPQTPQVPRLNLERIFKVAPVGAAGCLTVGFANGAYWMLAPLYAQSLGFTTREIVLFMSVFISGGAIVQWPLGGSPTAWTGAGSSPRLHGGRGLRPCARRVRPISRERTRAVLFRRLRVRGRRPSAVLAVGGARERPLPRSDSSKPPRGSDDQRGDFGPRAVPGAFVMAVAGPSACSCSPRVSHAADGVLCFSRIGMRNRRRPRPATLHTAPQGSPAALPLDPRGPEQVSS
jgi:MFS family permease